MNYKSAITLLFLASAISCQEKTTNSSNLTDLYLELHPYNPANANLSVQLTSFDQRTDLYFEHGLQTDNSMMKIMDSNDQGNLNICYSHHLSSEFWETHQAANISQRLDCDDSISFFESANSSYILPANKIEDFANQHFSNLTVLAKDCNLSLQRNWQGQSLLDHLNSQSNLIALTAITNGQMLIGLYTFDDRTIPSTKDSFLTACENHTLN